MGGSNCNGYNDGSDGVCKGPHRSGALRQRKTSNAGSDTGGAERAAAWHEKGSHRESRLSRTGAGASTAHLRWKRPRA